MGKREGVNRGKAGSDLGFGGAEGARSSRRSRGRWIREFGCCGRRAYQELWRGFSGEAACSAKVR